jgi:hypothetical protein
MGLGVGLGVGEEFGSSSEHLMNDRYEPFLTDRHEPFLRDPFPAPPDSDVDNDHL